MDQPTITCPQCKSSIKLTDSLAAPLLESTRQEYDRRMAEKDAAIARQLDEVKSREAAVAKAKESINDQVAAALKKEKEALIAEEAKKAKLLVAADLEEKNQALASLQAVLKQRDEKLAEAQKTQAELLRKQRELDDEKRELDLTIEKRVQAGLEQTRQQARQQAEDELKLKVAEKEQTIASMQRQIEDLKRRAEQGSQQLQGEVLELELEAILRTRFPLDAIQPVPKGEYGGDVLQKVIGAGGQSCGSILWESKRTRHWSDGWLSKLREDQRTAHAEFAVMVSQALPKELETFDLVDGVWVASPKMIVPVAIALRHALVELSAARQATEGQQSKMELVYQYLTGHRFRARVQAIVEKFSDMQEDLNKERKTMTKLWSKREEQIRCVIESTAGMYGDLQGIAGKSLQEIEGLELDDSPRLS